MKTSEPAEKMLTVIESLVSIGDRKPTQTELRHHTGINAATLFRILRTLEHRGYVKRDEDRRYHILFRMERDLPFNESVVQKLCEHLQKLLKETGQSAELLTIRGTNLYWYQKVEPPDPGVTIAARKGGMRPLYELDAPARMALAHRGLDFVHANMDRLRFYRIYPTLESLSWKEAEKIIQSVDLNGIELDEKGNSRGVRRYAMAVCDKQGKMLFLLSIAEAAIPAHDHPDHRNRIFHSLKRTKMEMEKLLQ